MPLPGAVSVADEFKVMPRNVRDALSTRIEQRRELNKPQNANDLNPRVPDWLAIAKPQVSLTEQDDKTPSRMRDQLSSVGRIGQAANEATQAGVEYRQREAAARAMASQQALSERQRELLNSIGGMDWGFGDITNAKGKRAAVINYGKQLLGQPYQWGGGHGNPRLGPVDCSGLVRYAFLKAGIGGVPNVSQTQMTWGKRTAIGKLLPGDLVGRGSPASHVAIYLGGGKILEAQKTGTRVHIRSIAGEGGWWGVHLNY